MQRAEALKEIIQSQYGHGHWRAGCGENRMPGSVGGRRKRVRTRGYLAGGLPCDGSGFKLGGDCNAERRADERGRRAG